MNVELTGRKAEKSRREGRGDKRHAIKGDLKLILHFSSSLSHQ